MEQFGEEVAEQADDMEQEQVAEQADDQFGEQADDIEQFGEEGKQAYLMRSDMDQFGENENDYVNAFLEAYADREESDDVEQFGEQADYMDQSEYDAWEHVAHTWKQWGDDEDVKTGLLDECDNNFNLRGLAHKKPHDGKRKWPKGTRGSKNEQVCSVC
jgi:hypothetical protein